MERVNRITFAMAYRLARKYNKRICNNTSVEVPENGTYFLYFNSLCEPMGFVISPDGELTNLFSEGKGHGDYLVSRALQRGATHLDCFDGYLVELYNKHGFEEYKRELNWTIGEPSVVYMKLGE